MGSGASSSKKPRNGSPTFSGNIKQPLFNGLLYRIIDEKSGKWAFYNDSRDYEFHINYLFGPRSELTNLGRTTMDDDDDGILCQVVVYPLETQMFIEGKVNGFECKMEALPLSDDYFSTHKDVSEEAYAARLAPPKAAQF